MKFSLTPIFLGAFILAAVSANAQQEVPAKAKKLFTKAEDLYSHFDYYNAIDYYKRFLELQTGHKESMLKIADSYYKIKEYDQTLLWYDSCATMGSMPPEHELQYANVLMNHGKNDKAIIWLKKYLVSHPNDKRANEKLNGLENTDQFFKDYRLYTITGFPYNSTAPDFSPTYYKDGLIFVSSRADVAKGGDAKMKSNEAYLDFYYVDNIKDTSKRDPVKLKGMNYRFHEGPLTIFDNGKKMIFTRNDYVKKGGLNGSSTVHFQMFYTECNDNMEWSTPSLLSIHDKQYSMGHPAVTEDGKTLYFASNIPGGYGGSDIYRSRWENNAWGKPVNLGAEINTEADEMFPFVLNDSILYFSSDGLRGLGGLDIFKYNLNFPTRVENVGYPVNSTKDDFGFVYNKNASTGYFSSNREGGVGNDDIYAFTVHPVPSQEETISARVFKEDDQAPLSKANVKIISFVKPDVDLIASEAGLINFYLPAGEAYIVIGSKEDYIGMYANTAMKDEEKSYFVHPVPTNNGHKNQIAVVGRILNKRGQLIPQATGTVTDKVTGEKVHAQFKDGLLSFLGNKGREYTISATDTEYQPNAKLINIMSNATGVQKVSITLDDKSSSFTLAARVFKQADKSFLSQAHVSIISFAEMDAELTANAEGIVEFKLPVGSPYVIIGSKDDYIGMYSGTVLLGENSTNIRYPVSTTNGHDNQIPVVGRILNKKNELLALAIGTVTDKATGEKIAAEIKDGLLTFYGDKGKSYTIAADEKDHQSNTVELSISSNATGVEKVSIILDDKSALNLAARVFKESDKSSLSEAHVSIISFAEADMELTTNKEGIIEFNLPVGSSYIIIANKDGYNGMYANTVLEGENKTNIVYPVSTLSGHDNQIPVVGRILNKKSEVLLHATGSVTDKATGEKISAEIKDGLLTFYGDKGKVYMIAAEEKDHQPTTVQVSISSNASNVEKISIILDDKSATTLAARVFKESDKSSLSGAHVSIISFAEPDMELTANGEGVAEFNLPVGSPYILIGSKDEYIGMYASTVLQGENRTTIIYPISTTNGHDNQIPVVGRVLNKKGELLTHATGTVTDKSTGKKIAAEFKEGLLNFYADKGAEYTITAEEKDYQSTSVQVSISSSATGVEKVSIMLDDKSPFAYTISAHVIKEIDQSPLPEAHISVISFAESDMELTANAGGVANFDLPVGTSYMVIGNKDGYTGIHVGVVKEGQDKLSVISVPVSNDAEKQLPIIGLVMDETRTPMPKAQAEVVDNATGQALSVKNENGILYFFGKKDGNYTVRVTADNYDVLKKNIDVNSFQSLVPTIEFRLNPVKKNSEDASVIIFNDVEFSKFYLTTSESNSEIIEKDGLLYLENEQGSKPLGNGSLSEFKKDPIKSLNQYGLSANRVVNIQNIFFDYDKALINDTHKIELDKMTEILRQYPFLKLYIGTNADGRGEDAYNLNLSVKRSNAIKDYLTKQKIDEGHLIVNSYGESAPIVQCTNCTEEDHQKNRRAEFSLSAMQAVPTAILPTAESTLVKKADVHHTPAVSTTYVEALERYGDKQLDGFVFKIGIGAYRLNHSLTFTELNDLGTIEKKLIDGIMYYYVSDFVTLRSAENARLEVITRGVKDAYVTFFYKDKKVPFSKFIGLIN